MPSDTEFSTLEAFVSVMKLLVEITEAIGGEKWITISTIRPILHNLVYLMIILRLRLLRR